MISVIICSRNQELLEKLKFNIKETIGVEYEIIAYDNSAASEGICKVYNLCSTKAKFEFLCYVHEDVHFITTDWGTELVSNYAEDTGVIGLAGGTFRSSFPSSWGDAGSEHSRANVYQTEVENHTCINPLNERYSQVVVLDGVFLFASKKVWHDHPFDEITFNRFHFYDQDFSINVSNKYKNYVCHTIGVVHYSYGSQDLEWVECAEKFCRKWEGTLPKSIGKITTVEKKMAEQRTLYFFIKNVLIIGQISKQKAFGWLLVFFVRYPTSGKFFTLLSKYFLYHMLKKKKHIG